MVIRLHFYLKHILDASFTSSRCVWSCFWKNGQKLYTIREDLIYANCYLHFHLHPARDWILSNSKKWASVWRQMKWRVVRRPPVPRWLLNYILHPHLQRGRKIVKWRFQGAVYLWIREVPCLAQHRPHCHSRLSTGLANKMTEEMVICRKGGGRWKEIRLRLRKKCFCINILQLKCQ